MCLPTRRRSSFWRGAALESHRSTEEAGVSDGGQQKIRISPCIRVRRDVEVEVTTGDTLEGLAIRHGLPPTAANRLKVMSSNDPSPTRLTNPESLKVGDIVLVPEVPIWTNVVAKPHVAADRAAIVAALASALQCGKEDPEDCLVKREVTLLNRATVPKREPVPDGPRVLQIAPAPAPPPVAAPPRPSLPKPPMSETPPAINPPALPKPSPSIPTPVGEAPPLTLPKPSPKVPEVTPSSPSPAGAAGAGGRGGGPTSAGSAASTSAPTAVVSVPSTFPPTVTAPPPAAASAPSAAPLPPAAPTPPGQPPAAAPPPPPPPPPPEPPPEMVVRLEHLDALNPAPAAAIATIPVAPEQWPYDVKLLAKILSDVADKVDRKTTVGIADGGLADATGGPLPGGVFAPSAEEINRLKSKKPEPDYDDNDGNRYMDDLFGAGLKRLNEDLGDLLGSGDMGLCKAAISGLAKWPTDVLTQASHGAIVTSIAAALGVRTSGPAAADALPKLVFFRMLGDTCEPAADLNVDVGELFMAFEYLAARSRIINISYKVDDSTGVMLRDQLRPLLPNLTALLVLAAGNQNMNLDDNGAVCPACLGHSSDDRGGAASKRTIVVGAATRDLRREPRSNYGKDTVKLFAPGDPTTGIDLLVNNAPASLASTSFAAPYAALAAAIISSFGDHNNWWADVRDRLEATVWPLHDPGSGAEETGLGVVDLVKAAAVRHDAIEVKERDADGQLGTAHVRRNAGDAVGRPGLPRASVDGSKGSRAPARGSGGGRLAEGSRSPSLQEGPWREAPTQGGHTARVPT